MPSTGGRGWAGSGPGGGNVAYRNQGLQFRPVEVNLDESVSIMTLILMFVRAFLASLLVWFVYGIVMVFLMIAGADPGLLITVGSILSGLAFWIVLLFPETTEPIAEWRTLLEDKSPAASSAYAVIYGALNRRRIPVTSAPLRIRTDILSQEIVNNRLTITDQNCVVYVSVFEYGTSLYVGWQMYRTRRGAELIWRFVKDLLGGFLGRSGLIAQMLRTERARAMREAVHSAVREGVEVAIAGIDVPITATFGHDLPIMGDTAFPSQNPFGEQPAWPSEADPAASGLGVGERSAPPPPSFDQPGPPAGQG